MDTRSVEQRRRIMQSVKSKNTAPELKVRRWLHRQGFRYRLHLPGTPGRPDIAFTKRKVAVFVHGCFWHAHGCAKGGAPKSNIEFWGPKLRANQDRDAKKMKELRELGWTTVVVWQCETGDESVLQERLLPVLRKQ